jgi:hypothetical protein
MLVKIDLYPDINIGEPRGVVTMCRCRTSTLISNNTSSSAFALPAELHLDAIGVNVLKTATREDITIGATAMYWLVFLLPASALVPPHRLSFIAVDWYKDVSDREYLHCPSV